jgi:hypothetical protein
MKDTLYLISEEEPFRKAIENEEQKKILFYFMNVERVI